MLGFRLAPSLLPCTHGCRSQSLLWRQLQDMGRTWKRGPGAGFGLQGTCAFQTWLCRISSWTDPACDLAEVEWALLWSRRTAAHLLLHLTPAGHELCKRQDRLHVLPGSGGRVDFRWPGASLPMVWTSESFWTSAVVLLAEWALFPVGAIPGRRQLCFAWPLLFGLLSLEEAAARKDSKNHRHRVATPRIRRGKALSLSYSLCV